MRNLVETTSNNDIDCRSCNATGCSTCNSGVSKTANHAPSVFTRHEFGLPVFSAGFEMGEENARGHIIATAPTET